MPHAPPASTPSGSRARTHAAALASHGAVGLLTALVVGPLFGCPPAGLPLPTAPASAEDRLVAQSRTGSEAARRAARRRLERFRFARARRQSTVLGWRRFLQHHPRGLFADQAANELAQARYRLARKADTVPAYQRFLKRHGGHTLAKEAWQRLDTKLADDASRARSRETILSFLRRYPRSPHRDRLRQALERLDRRALTPAATLHDLETFQLRYPTSRHRPAVRRRIAERLAERVAHFGDQRDLAGFRRRFPRSRLLPGLQRRVRARTVARATLALDARALQARPLPDPAGRAALRRWVLRRPAAARALRVAIARALPWRPSARPTALQAAAGVADPRTAAYAVRALAYVPTLSAAETILRAVGSTDSAVSSYAVDALARWARLHAPGPARRLLSDRAARLRKQRDAAARVQEAALRRTVGEWPRLLALLAGRKWHRPWSVVPHYLWLETLPARAGDATDKAGGRALRAYQDEHRKLSQMLPAQVRQANRRRAEAAVFELDRLAHTASRLVSKHGATGGRWVAKLRVLAARCRRQRDDGDRQLGGFPGYRSVLVDRIDEERRQHRAGRSKAKAALLKLLRRYRPPSLLGRTLCGLGQGRKKRLTLPCRKGLP